MLTQCTLGLLYRKDLYGRLVEYAGMLAKTAAGAGLGMHDRLEDGMPAGPCISTHYKGYCISLDGAGRITDFTAQSLQGDTVFPVHENRHAHPGLFDLRQVMIESTAGACLNAGNILAHVTGDIPNNEIRRADGDA